jgi:hypothetical protein
VIFDLVVAFQSCCASQSVLLLCLYKRPIKLFGLAFVGRLSGLNFGKILGVDDRFVTLQTQGDRPAIRRGLATEPFLGGDCVKHFLAQLPSSRWKTRSINRWQHRLKREHPTCTERKNAHTRVRMEGWRQWRLGGKRPCPMKKRQNPLVSDGPSHGRRLHQPLGYWCNGGV